MPEILKAGRKSFYELLRPRACELVGRVVREQLTHGQYLAGRQEIYASKAYARSTSTARVQLDAYLQGAIDMLYTTAQVVWKHRGENGEWILSPAQALRGREPSPAIDYSKIDPEASRHVWADSNRPWFERESV